MAEQSPQQEDVTNAYKAKSNQRKWPLYLGIFLAVLAGGWAFRSSPSWAAGDALAEETEAEISIYRRHFFSTSEIVFDVRSVKGSESAVGMTRKLLKVAEALQGNEYEKVYLSYDGEEKFFLEGKYFKQLGVERAWQNPVYTIRTMPQNVKTLDGGSAFSTWSGGLLGVMGQQMNDQNQFHRDWWVSDAIADM